jgi:ATP-dependent protease HslVU (ClpYQ) peptidase subunit
MTTLVGLYIPEKGSWIASDGQTTMNMMKAGSVQKWVRHGRWAVGCAGDLKTLTLMQADVEQLLHGVNSIGDVVKRIERMLVSHNYTAATDGPFGPPAWGQNFLVASDDGLWDIDLTLSVFPVSPNTVWSVGSGREFSLGAGFATPEIEPAERVRLALGAAYKFDAMTGMEPFYDHIPSVAPPLKPKTTKIPPRRGK